MCLAGTISGRGTTGSGSGNGSARGGRDSMRGNGAGTRPADVVVAPIFQLLGEGRLAQREIEALVTVLEADGLPIVPATRLARAHQIARIPVARAREVASIRAPIVPHQLLATLQVDV